MIDVLGYLVDKLPWILAGYLAGAGTKDQLTRASVWVHSRGSVDRDGERARERSRR